MRHMQKIPSGVRAWNVNISIARMIHKGVFVELICKSSELIWQY